MAREAGRYRFGPLERRGLIAGWRAGQIGSVAAGLVVGVLVLRSSISPVDVLVAVVALAGGVAMAWWPVNGRAGDEWLPTVARWGTATVTGRRRWRTPTPAAGRYLGGGRLRSGAGRPVRKAERGPFAGLGLLEVDGTTEEGVVGMVHDSRSRTYTAVMALRGHSFALLGSDEKDRRIAGWAAVLSSLARERPVVRRLQWLATTLPDDGQAVSAFLAEQAVLDVGAPARRSYGALLAAAGASTCRHEVLLAVQVRAGGRPGGRCSRTGPVGSPAACAVLLRELAALRRVLSEADVSVERVLGPRALAGVFRRSGQPGPLGALAADRGPSPGPMAESAIGHADREGRPWPSAVEADWSRLRTDGTWQVTYWIAEWPRVEVGPDFLGPLLLGSVRRTVSVVMEPLSPGRALRQAEQSRTADLADAELRRRGGFLATARRTRESELAVRRETELADGHAAIRFSGYVTVTAPTVESLDEACEATEQAAGQCRLELRRLYGDQEAAFIFSLPLGRGLA